MSKKPDVKVDCFFIQIRKPKKRGAEENQDDDNFMNFGEIEGGIPDEDGVFPNSNFVNVFEKYVNSFENRFFVQESNGHALNLDNESLALDSGASTIRGRVKGGTSGTGKEITPRDNAGEIDFSVTTAHVDSRDYYFCLWIPPERSRGLLLIQGLSQFSISYTMVTHLKQFIKREYNLIAEFNKFIPKEYVEKVRNESVIEEIILTKHQLPADPAHSLTGLEFIEGGRVTVEVRVKSIRDYSDQIKEALRIQDPSNFLFGSMPVLQGLGMDDQTTQRTIKYDRNGKKATAKASNNFDISPTYYAEEENIDYDENTNLPTQESAERFILEVLEIVQIDLRELDL